MSFIDHFLKEVTTDNGTIVWVRGVPPYTLKEVYVEHPSPALPIVTLESEAGSERKMALPGSPEYVEYQEAMKGWRIDTDRAMIDHHIAYGVVKWKFPWDEEVYGDPPEDWTPAASISHRYKDMDAAARKLLFIKTCLLLTQEDVEQVDVILYAIKPVEKKDIDAALVPTLSRSGEDHPNLGH